MLRDRVGQVCAPGMGSRSHLGTDGPGPHCPSRRSPNSAYGIWGYSKTHLFFTLWYQTVTAKSEDNVQGNDSRQ